MDVAYLKNAEKSALSETSTAREVAEQMLANIAQGREDAVRAYGKELDGWSGPILVSKADIQRRSAEIPEQVEADIPYAIANVCRFAEAQCASISDTQIEFAPGVTLLQKLVPCGVAGCHVPMGCYAHVALCLHVGCDREGRRREEGDRLLDPLSRQRYSSLCPLRHVSGRRRHNPHARWHTAIVSMACGLFTGHPADILVGPGIPLYENGTVTKWLNQVTEFFARTGGIANPVMAETYFDPNLFLDVAKKGAAE